MNIQKYLDLSEYKLRDKNDKDSGFWSFKLESIAGESKEYRIMSNLIMDSDLDIDSAYQFTVEALEAMKDIDELRVRGQSIEDVLNDPKKIASYSEAPIYTSELIKWVSKGTNYTFVEDAIDEYGGKNQEGRTDLIQSIQIGYSRAWEEHYYKVLEAIKP